MKVLDMKNPNSKMMGIEAVRSSTPAPVVKLYLRSSSQIIMEGTEDELINFIDKIRGKEYSELNPEESAFPRMLNNINRFRSCNYL